MNDGPRGRPLPVLPGAPHLGFRCNGCGDCCRAVRVALTHHDLERLATGLARPAPRFVEWLAPDDVDMTDEPGSFVELREGRRLMVLLQDEGACHLLDDGQRCTAYAHRPLDCRLYPLDLSRDDAGDVVSVSRLDPNGCGDEAGPSADVGELAALDARRWRELAEYQARVARWNRIAAHRRRFGRAPGDAAEFLAFIARPSPSHSDERCSGAATVPASREI
ncbi:MAG TPA: YkgJ family cysteine cluster protein [Polyangiaceae bacterium]|nr:YkgJ family cysteine cluster protein [Polyangiaceae bacterium]